MEYSKPFQSIAEQIQLLRNRGLVIDNDAEHYLRHLNYYRLSGYWLFFETNKQNHRFRVNTHFDAVLNLYIFDRELRLWLLDSVERIEVSIRTHWAYCCAEIFGTHAHLNSAISRKEHWQEKNLYLLAKEVNRSHESFIKHYRKKYQLPQEPPIWVACEVMSLGLLSRYLKDLKPSEISNQLAKIYHTDYAVLTSFIEHLTYIRNLCAHHSRVWNRKFTKTMKLPKTKPIQLISSFNRAEPRRLYNTLLMLIHFLNIISPKNHMKQRLLDLLEKHSIDVKFMGFPDDWQERNAWKCKGGL
jgi:abortive infection bacteriophage resistance protein